MASEHLTSNAVPLSLKRREDLTVEELKNLACFKDHSDETLAAIIEAVKGFTRTILYIHTKDKGMQSRNQVIDLTTNPQRRRQHEN